MKRDLFFFSCFLLISGLFPSCDCSDERPPITSDSDLGQSDLGPDRSTDLAPDLNEKDADMGKEEPCQDCREDQICDQREGGFACACAAGFSEEQGACVEDVLCKENTCNSHGDCLAGNGVIECQCNAGWTSAFCDTCDEENGFKPDGNGGCTDDLCTTITCGEKVCEIENETPVCVCPAGTHTVEDTCVIDTTCSERTCNMHGDCQETDGATRCSCEAGWAAPNCATCDEMTGFHDDGLGGCTTDPCLPNACQDPNRSQCVANGTSFTCDCDAGFHLDQGSCIADQVCQIGTCSMHGSCNVMDGQTRCICNSGYLSEDCSQCDLANGFHDDGEGGCTSDLCLPNPCDQITNKTQCTSSQNGTMCGCDVGYHDDGSGGCTQDPCLPDLCAQNNQACRVTNGQAECYTPVCDDANACTSDALVNGMCEFTPLSNIPCAGDACSVSGMCNAGVCEGEQALNCDDANPCTDDSCDMQTGCVFVNDDTNLPDDGIGCTDDVCTNGFASNQNNDANCNDSLFCNGEEICSPASQSADAQGCISISIPVPPSDPGPCSNYGACDEANDNFLLINLPQGSVCEDGIVCTSADVCDALGQCVGNLQMNCDSVSSSCASITPFSNHVNIPTTQISATITVDGQPLSSLGSTDSTSQAIYAVNAEGVRHPIAYISFNGSMTPVVSYGDRLIPGVYDILFVRGSRADGRYVYRSTPGDALPTGINYLERDVVVPAGSYHFNIDIPVTQISATITVDGQPLSSLGSTDSTSQAIYAVNADGVRHPIAYVSFNGSMTPVVSYGDRLNPGVYDILFVRGSRADGRYVYRSTPGDALPTGIKYLQRNVVVGAGSHHFDIDIPTTLMTSTITVDGQPLSSLASTDSISQAIYAVNADGVRHPIAYVSFNGSMTPVISYGDRIHPGTYDILFVRGSRAEGRYVYRSTPSDALPTGIKYLQRDVVVGQGSHHFNIDIPTTVMTATITVDGQPLSSLGSTDSTSQAIYAVNAAGVRHPIAYVSFNGSMDPVISYGDRIHPGTYDILFVRGSRAEGRYVYRSTPGDALPTGIKYLQRDVVVGQGSHHFNIDILTTSMSGTITVDGQPLSSLGSTDSTSQAIYAVNAEGVRHPIAYLSFNGSMNPVISSGDRIHPGTYDILFVRGSRAEGRYVYRSTPGDALPTSINYLQRDVVIGAGSFNYNIDIPVHALSTTFSVDGQPLVSLASTDSTSQAVYAVNKEGVRHPLGYISFNGSMNPVLSLGDRIVPGVYDILFVRGSRADGQYVYRSTPGDALPTGINYLQRCVSIP